MQTQVEDVGSDVKELKAGVADIKQAMQAGSSKGKLYLKSRRHHSKVLTLVNRFIGSNLWVSPWIARDEKLKSALVSEFTQLSLISKLVQRVN